jgi:hypothetical protein
LQRCLAEGHSKALVAGEVGSGDALASEWPYAVRVLTAGAARGVRDALQGRPEGLLRTFAICTGLGATTYGYLSSRVRLDRERRRSLKRR